MRRMMLPSALITVMALSACTTVPASETSVVTMASPAAAPAEVPVIELVNQVAIPHETFQLDNGLTVIVHEDRKAPIVAVSTWYNVGSKDEPRGKTGFAHLFEHLMFNGSENAEGDFFEYLQQMGATDYNGTTHFDRTNYFQTVPTGALEKALFLESDRMGYLLGAVTQAKLDNQRGVVQNEKRQGDNRPGGLVFYEVLRGLFPEGHPYRHSPIGSMADLDAASLADVREWFVNNYGPNNAVLVLAGDIDAVEARPLVERYFGSISRGPVNEPAQANIPSLTAPQTIVMKDQVAATQVQKYWPMPGILDQQLVALDVAGSILGGLASSRLDQKLVREEKIAVQVSAGNIPFQRVGIFTATAVVKPGVDPTLVERRLEEVIQELIAEGPTADEVRRAAMRNVSQTIKGLEQVGGFGGKAVALAEGEVYANDPEFYAKKLQTYASVTPQQVQGAMQRWLTRPALTVRLEPGERGAYQEAVSSGGAAASKVTPSTAAAPPGEPRPMPELKQLQPLDFPDVTHAVLSNGIRVHYAQRTAAPVTQLALSFDAGYAADAPGGRGLQNLTTSLLDEGTTTRSSQQIAEAQERLGASISTGSSADRSTVTLSTLTPTLAPSLDLLADVVKNPAFLPEEVERVRAQTLTAISQQQKDPNGIAQRAIPALVYGPNHPYATTAIGEPGAVASFNRGDLLRFKDQYLRPDNLQIFVISDKPLPELTPMLENHFGRWQPPAGIMKGTKAFTARPVAGATPRIVLIDRPNSPQSVIVGGLVTPVNPRGDVTALTSANDVLGGNFLSRINMDLRETRGWSYGVRGSLQLNEQAVPYFVSAPVQADRTGESVQALIDNFEGFLGPEGVTPEELKRTINNNIRQLPGQFETSAAVLRAMQTNALLGRPADYYEKLADKYRGQTTASLDAAARAAINPDNFIWVVVGEAAKIRPQLAKLGIPIEVMTVSTAPASGAPSN